MSYLQFVVGEQYYALPVTHVIEVLHLVDIVSVPDQPADHLGVITLRGQVIPVIDLSIRYVGSPSELTITTPLIAVRKDDMTAALVVKQVDDVVNLPDSFEPYPQPGIDAILRHEDRVILLPNVDALLHRQPTP